MIMVIILLFYCVIIGGAPCWLRFFVSKEETFFHGTIISRTKPLIPGNPSVQNLKNTGRNNQMFKKKFTTQQIVLTGMLAALAGVLMSLEISVPMMPPFYKFDFSDVPAIVALFLMGPVEGALVEVIKLVIKLLLTGTNSMYVGELVNLMAIILFIIPTWIVYKKMGQTRKAAAVALIVSVVIRTSVACFLNACVSLPLYATAMGVSLDDVVKMVGGVNARIQNLQTFIIYATIPFNAVKLSINSFIGYAIYDRLLAAIPAARDLRTESVQGQEAA